MGRWEHFAHEADIGVRGYGVTLAEAFEQAAVALTAVITEPERVVEKIGVRIACSAPDVELLFADWLNSLIYEMATRHMLFARFEVGIDGTTLRATAWGELTDVPRHQPAVEVKGATYTGLRVAREGEYWVAQTIVDV